MTTVQRFRKASCIVAASSFLWVAGSVRPASAAVTSVTIDVARSFKAPGVKDYRYVEATMSGTVDRPSPALDGVYSVGLVLIFPTRHARGVGLVDWPNSAFYSNYGYEPREDMTVQFSRSTTDNYLFQNGYTYASVQWNKEVTDLFGPAAPDDGELHNPLVFGTIEDGSDAWQILRDAADFLKNPSTFQGTNRPAPVSVVLSSGFSQSAAIQMEFLSQGENLRDDGSSVYDGFLINNNGLGCWERNNIPPGFGNFGACDSFPTGGDAEVMVIASQTDMEFLAGGAARGTSDPNFVLYELPGVSHLAIPVFDVSSFGATRQNPADPRPFFRGAVRNLTDWVVSGALPPPEIEMAGTVGPDGNLVSALDADGNALGGIRLPHMRATLPGGQLAGAPCGAYGGVEPAGIDPFNVFLLVGGTFEPFSEQERESRYPTRAAFQQLVTRSAEQLFEAGYILKQDRDAYERQSGCH